MGKIKNAVASSQSAVAPSQSAAAPHMPATIGKDATRLKRVLSQSKPVALLKANQSRNVARSRGVRRCGANVHQAVNKVLTLAVESMAKNIACYAEHGKKKIVTAAHVHSGAKFTLKRDYALYM